MRVSRLVRRLSAWVARGRRGLRNSAPWLIVLCAALGAVVGGVVVLMHEAVALFHSLAYHLPYGEHISAGLGLSRMRVMAIPALGGALLGLLGMLSRRLGRRQTIVDPIEANAVYGGRMSLSESLRLALVTLLSNGVGGSVGMEAAYTQMGAGLMSRFGRVTGLRRADLRVFVGAGAAAAIAAAFNAPLAGAFYAFELVLATYTVGTLAQIASAAAAGALVVRMALQVDPIFHVPGAIVFTDWDYLLCGLLGVAAAALAVVTMWAVGACEGLVRRLPVAEWARPLLGGAFLSLIALSFPQVLGSGQGAIQIHFNHPWPLAPLAALLVAKILASALSIGSGFRGGLFSSSLFIGCLFGETAARLVELAFPAFAGQEVTFMLVGMGSVAAAIIGAPMTMVLLTLEMTGNFPATLGVFVGVVVASALVRHTFGFSFSTWRFHLRGLPIRGAEDIGWLSELTVGRLMRGLLHVVPQSMPLAALRETVPAGVVRVVYAVDDAGRFAGWIDTAQIHDRELDIAADGVVAADLAQGRHQFLVAGDDIQAALDRFRNWMVEELVVVSSTADPRPIGSLSEAYALKRYSQALETRAGIGSGLGGPSARE